MSFRNRSCKNLDFAANKWSPTRGHVDHVPKQPVGSEWRDKTDMSHPTFSRSNLWIGYPSPFLFNHHPIIYTLRPNCRSILHHSNFTKIKVQRFFYWIQTSIWTLNIEEKTSKSKTQLTYDTLSNETNNTYFYSFKNHNIILMFQNWMKIWYSNDLYDVAIIIRFS